MSLAVGIDEIEAARASMSAAGGTLEGVWLDTGSAGVFGDGALAGAAAAFSAGGRHALQAGASEAMETAAALSGSLRELIGTDERVAAGASARAGQVGLR